MNTIFYSDIGRRTIFHWDICLSTIFTVIFAWSSLNTIFYCDICRSTISHCVICRITAAQELPEAAQLSQQADDQRWFFEELGQAIVNQEACFQLFYFFTGRGMGTQTSTTWVVLISTVCSQTKISAPGTRFWLPFYSVREDSQFRQRWPSFCWAFPIFPRLCRFFSLLHPCCSTCSPSSARHPSPGWWRWPWCTLWQPPAVSSFDRIW